MSDSSAKSRTPARVWVGLFLAVALDVPVQLIWKALMDKFGGHYFRTGDTIHFAQWFLHQPRTWILLGLFVCQFFDWIWVLGNADLSFAQPFTALSYVGVSTFAVLVFNEQMTAGRVVGIFAILIGVILIGSSDHRTTGAASITRAAGLIVVLASTVSEAVGQFGFKKAAGNPSAGPRPVASVFANWRWLALGYGGFIVDGFLWSTALKMLPLTIAHPAGSLVFVTVAVFSRVFSAKKLSPKRWLGIGCILFGVVLVVTF